MITGKTAIYGIVGRPVGRSLSPAIHNQLFAEREIDAVYVPFEADPGLSVAAAIRALGVRGCNLTFPFKTTIVADLDEMSPAAARVGAVNVVLNDGGRLSGHNTDGEGFVRGFEAAFGSALEGAQVLVLGAGGAARAVAAGVADRGAREVVFMNRTIPAAAAAAQRLAAGGGKTRFVAAPLAAMAFSVLAPSAGVVINCTTGEADATIVEFDDAILADQAIWCDINYWSATPPVLGRCRDSGLRVQDGLPMLVHQAALSFELFTGTPVDAAHIRVDLR